MGRMVKTLISGSVLSGDHGRLCESAADLVSAGVDMIHLDVMDGVFVPVLTFGSGAAKSIKKTAGVPLDVHLMVSKPENLIEAFARAGSDYITVHAEVTDHLDRLLSFIKDLGCKAGVAVNPSTSSAALKWILPKLDMVLVMTVNPGYGGQSYIEYVGEKITEIRSMLDDGDCRNVLLSVDGGVNRETAADLRKRGVDVLVAGSFLFSAGDMAEAVSSLR